MMKKYTTAQILIVIAPQLLLGSNKTVFHNPRKAEHIKIINNLVKLQSYKVDNQSSKITWLAKKVTGEHTGNINISYGIFNVENNTLKDLNLDIDVRSITDVDVTDKASNDKLVSTLKGETFFNSDKYPKANFLTTTVVYSGGLQYTIKGKLTIKGIANEVSFPATISISKNKLMAKAKISIDRTKYDIKIRSKSFFENLGDKVIYDDIDLDIMLIANQG